MLDRVGAGAPYGPMRLLVPALYIERIYDLPLSWLKENSVKAVITDLDNTLVPWRDYRVASELADWFKDLHDAGFKTVILSNARPSPTITELSKLLETDLVVGARKPLTRFFKIALSRAGTAPHETCVIGDQVFTDILGGNMVGCRTVLVKQVGRREFLGTRFMRLIEKAVFPYILRHTVREVRSDDAV